MDEKPLRLNFDGSCWPNPGGPAKFGWILSLDGKTLASGRGVCQDEYRTNNVAEFRALEDGIRWLLKSEWPFPPAGLEIVGDSALTINALNKGWTMPKSPHLAAIMESIRQLLKQLNIRWTARWVRREQNAEADAISR